ncbi:hypothetical protein [Pseudomonas sp. 2FE]|uniref:hypothetical protein n=1 Tax=Pseudomonas sp. 2FE TaxID=2502190 RepID=UPI0010F739D6|nr:hypothetical protein [Pseudomonas sp. 2FE]
MKFSHAVRVAILGVSVSVLAGCATGPQSSGIHLPDPSTVPKDKWSDAMVVFNEMGLAGRRDIPRAIAEQHGLLNGSGDVAHFAVDQMEGSTSVGTTVLMVGGSTSLSNLPQVAAWVPSELAGSPQEAADLLSTAWQEARTQAFPKTASGNQLKASMFMNGQLQIQGEPLERLQTLRSSKPAPSFISAKTVVGPVFIPLGVQLTADARGNGMTKQEAAIRMSAHLPSWVYIYQGGSKMTRPMSPPAMYNKGNELFFIGK